MNNRTDLSRGAQSKRVLIIVENLPVPPDRRVWQECLALRHAGYEVAVICPKGRGYTRSYEILDGVHIYRHALPFEAAGAAGFVLEYAIAFAWEMWLTWRVFLTRGFDVIQACNPPDTIWLVALPFKVFFRCKFVFDHHDPFPELFAVKFPHKGFLLRATQVFERISMRFADMVITTSEALRRIAIKDVGIQDNKIHLVRSCPDPQKMRRVTPYSLRQRDAVRTVVYVGIMGSQDGVDILLQAAHETLHTHGRCDVRYLLIGDGPELARLRELARDLDIADHVTFTGFLHGEQLLAALSSADIGICPDPRNPYNDKLTLNKVLEYMALELPIVMFDLSEGRTIADEAAVYVAGDNDPRALADAALELLDDPARRRRMGLFGRQRIEREFDWRKQEKTYTDAYAGLWGRQ
jgi:glycosyltransferase involved in cell wall biosynthesis